MNSNLKKETLDFIKLNGFDELTSVQNEVLKFTSSNKDVIALSKTGTGKTHAYLILCPYLHHLVHYKQSITLFS